ncbi:type II 3-dehydroquinate dehydratase [Mesobacterium pallidum]|uniref:type II 3-dehydroquinate dehydratase n=1 Tax=Mesobacterium pallidum TaxID=2872037 RepID=UPI001EE26B58|nr:type II 3-dehydroquinate dehydratase [Mesobacterium pallidum]
MSAPAIHVLNGPNLNLLGQREPHIYGATTLAEVEHMCRAAARGPLEFHQTNHEGAMIERIHAARETAAGIVINPAGWTFRSVAILDALKTFDGPIIELHISNIHARDPIYHDSLISAVATAVIAGLGAAGYPVAVQAMYGLIG